MSRSLLCNWEVSENYQVSIIRKLDFKFGSFFTEELKILNNNLMQYLHLFIFVYPVQYAKRLVT